MENHQVDRRSKFGQGLKGWIRGGGLRPVAVVAAVAFMCTALATFSDLAKVSVRAATTCPGGGTNTQLVSGLDAVAGLSATALDRSSNLAANGDFTVEPVGLGSAEVYLWGASGRTADYRGVTRLNSAIPSWGRSGGSPIGTASNAGTYATWSKQASDTTPNRLLSRPTNGQSDARVYFGNQVAMSIDPIPTFDSNGFSTTNYSIIPKFDILSTPNVSYGTASTPPAIDQSIVTEVGRTYRMHFL